MPDPAPALPALALPAFVLTGEAATARAGAALAAVARPGDTILLEGDLGAGKSTLARGFIANRLAAEGRAEDIPSPSYTLVNVYETAAARIWHADLYRLGDAVEEVDELGLVEAFGTDIVLVEWPDRLGPALPSRRLTLYLDFAPGDTRRVRAEAAGPGWGAALTALAGAAR